MAALVTQNEEMLSKSLGFLIIFCRVGLGDEHISPFFEKGGVSKILYLQKKNLQK